MTTGRRKIDNNDRASSHSERASSGDLITEKKMCPFCGHNKVFYHTSFYGKNRYKCTKCKREIQW